MENTPVRPNLLVTNDDGIDAAGINHLRSALEECARVVTIAPDRERSAVSHAFSLNHPLRLKRLGDDMYSLSGTPADCVMFALRGFLESADRPQLVFSGINHGANLGQDVLYSGTVAGALEAVLFETPAVAISLATEYSGRFEEQHLHFETAARVARFLAQRLLSESLPPQLLLNVNVPNVPLAQLTGVSITTLGRRIYRDRVIQRMDPHGREYYWLGGEPPDCDPTPGSDFEALENSRVSITPLRWCMCHEEDLELLAGWRDLEWDF